MHSKDSSPEGGDGQLSDVWWATLAVRLLHPVQVQIIEALRCVGQPLSLRDLSEIVNDVEWVHLDYHIGRLRRLGALDFTGLRQGDSVMDVRYQLVPEGWSHGPPAANSSSGIRAMCRSSSKSPQERDLWVENVVLLEIITLHPDHLTREELVVRMEDAPSNTGRVAIMDSLQALRRSGLVRQNGDVVEPTYAALRAAAIFQP